MLNRNRYKNSICKNNYLHDFRIVKHTNVGVLERCSRCGKQVHFPNDISNHVYLSYHVRSALQPGEPLYNHEYKTR